MRTHIEAAIELLQDALAAIDSDHDAAVLKVTEANLEVGKALASAGGIDTGEDDL
ncbi:MAG: hypothetical protein ABIZ80_01120 [Bryobacteraceae bacterium]